MSSRLENDDPWLRHGTRTANRGPRQLLRAAGQPRTPGMTGPGQPTPEQPPRSADEGWRVFSSMIAGMVIYGGIGWLIGHWTGISILFPLGMLLGIVLSVLMIIFKFSRF
jgi:ATP synthase protein I